MRFKVLLAISFMLQMAGCGFEAAPTSALETPEDSYHVIYGKDSIRDENSASLNSVSSVALVKKETFERYQKDQAIYTAAETFGGEDLSWTNQPSLAFCSGVLVDKDLVLTAGHCLDAMTCEDLVFVFGYEAQGKKPVGIACKEVVKVKNDLAQAKLDYALIRLQKEAPALPVSMQTAALKVGDGVYSIGYPLGTYKKKATGRVRSMDHGVAISTLDVFEGNSGSPIFSAKTHRLVGILSSGETDFVETDSDLKVHRCGESECSGEFIISIEKVLADIRK